MRADGRLLAKSYNTVGLEPPRSALLHGHLADVHSAAVQVLECTGEQQLRAIGLVPAKWRDRLWRTVRLAAAVHDLGKANDHFQGMVRGERQAPQGLRHEWATLLILDQPGWREWLSIGLADPCHDWEILRWCVSGHHPQYNRPSPPRMPIDGAGSTLTLLLDRHDFGECMSWLAREFGLKEPEACRRIVVPLVGHDSAFTQIVRRHVQSVVCWETLDDEARRFVAVVKACLIAADVAGSALPRAAMSEQARSFWVGAALGDLPTTRAYRAIVEDRLNGASLMPFQEEVARTPERVTLVTAGCGSGKTVAAYHWAAQCADGKRLYICYPTTGTATEGFRDYLLDVSVEVETGPDRPRNRRPRANTALFHSRRDIDLELLGVRGDEDRDDMDAVARLASLEAWSTCIVSCTTDTVLGLVQNNKRGLYAWPALAQSAFVFDEIHAYDERLFGALLRFIGAMRGVPILLMSASLPDGRRAAIEHSLQRQGEKLATIAGPANLEQLKRYYRMMPTKPNSPIAEVGAELKRGGRVLWVCNTVDRALRAAERMAAHQPLIYHSRFKYEDRVRHHAAVVDAFNARQVAGAALAICTQVAEMSLDLSATLLVTDLAPVPALIQRLGRLNRRATPPASGEPHPPTMPFITVEPLRDDGSFVSAPYSPDELAVARLWLDALGCADRSQSDLADEWRALDDGSAASVVASAWLDGGPVTDVRELRNGSHGITVIMEEDVPRLRRREKRALEVTLPMLLPPKGVPWRQWPAWDGIPIAPCGTIAYDERGGQWRQ